MSPTRHNASTSRAAYTPYATPRTSASDLTASNDPADSDPPRIPKGLTMGSDDFAAVIPEAMFNKWKILPRCRRRFEHRAQRELSQEEFEQALWEHCQKQFTNPRVRGAHPKATDESVHYTVIPDSPYGRLTIRWWNQFDWGCCFDFVDVAQRKVVAPPPDVIIMLEVEDGSWIYIRSIEDAHERVCKGSNTRFDFKLNDDGIIEQKWNAPGGGRIALHQKGCAVPFAVLYVPQDRAFKEHDVPEYRPVKPQ